MATSHERNDFAISIDEIHIAIFRDGGLTRADLAHAAQVNHVWHLVASRFLWRTVEMIDSQKYHHEFRQGLLNHGRFVKTLITTSDKLLDWIAESQACSMLSCFNFRPQQTNNQTGSSSVSLVIKQNPELQVLRFHPESRDLGRASSELVDGLVSLNQGWLTTLDLDSVLVDFDFTEVFDHHQGMIEVLKLTRCKLSPSMFANIKTLSSIKVLTLDENEYWEDNPQDKDMDYISILESMVEVEVLTVVTRDREFVDELGAVLSDLENLEKFSMKLTMRVKPGDDSTAFLFYGFQEQLEELGLEGFNIGHDSNEALRYVVGHSRLTTIRLLNCGMVDSETWNVILTQCPYLTTILGDEYSPMDANIIDEAWASLDIERFEMYVLVGEYSSMTIANEALAEEDKEKRVWHDCQSIFAHLGALRKLKIAQIKLDAFISRTKHVPFYSRKAEKYNRKMEADLSMGEEFVAMWSYLESWSVIEKILIWMICLPSHMVNMKALNEKTRDMWGDQVEVDVQFDKRGQLSDANRVREFVCTDNEDLGGDSEAGLWDNGNKWTDDDLDDDDLDDSHSDND